MNGHLESRCLSFSISDFKSAPGIPTTDLFIYRWNQNVKHSFKITLFNYLLGFLQCLCQFSTKFVTKKGKYSSSYWYTRQSYQYCTEFLSNCKRWHKTTVAKMCKIPYQLKRWYKTKNASNMANWGGGGGDVRVN